MPASSSSVPASRAAIWVAAMRPKTLPAAFAPVLLGSAMAWDAGEFHVVTALCILVAALLIQIGTNFSNDYADYVKGADTAARKGPLRIMQAGLVSPRALKGAIVAAFSLAFCCGLHLVGRGGWPILLIGILSILSGIWYTVGRYSLAYLGLGDIFVLIFFGPVAVGGTYYVHTGMITTMVLIAGLTTGLLCVAILLVNNIRDIDEDRQAHKKTLVVRFGRRFGVGLWAFCVVVAALIPLEMLVFSGGSHPWAGAAIIIVLPAMHIFHKLRTETDSVALNPLLGGTSILLLVHSLLFSAGWVLWP